ncbi:MAG: hypothetical protein JWO09_654 [Bacteroidetes bacterium]|nr:hypothetical protein [Bacteroidota bacterium]
MANIIEIKTNKSVFDFATIFLDQTDIEIIREFDSANYGIGYDLIVRHAACRLFDGLDTQDENDPTLYLEIDRENILSPTALSAVVVYLSSILKRKDFIIA